MYKLLSSHPGYIETFIFKTMGALLWFLNYEVKKTSESTIWTEPQRWVVYHPSCSFALKKTDGYIHPIVRLAPITYMFTHWVNELFDAATDHGQRTLARRPHEMLRGQWDAIQALSSPPFNAMAKDAGCYLDQFSRQQHISKLFMEKFGYPICGPLYDGYQVNLRHEVHVCYALAFGKEVPAEVVAEYVADPELLAYCSAWKRHIVKKPFLRGQFNTVSMLSSLVCLLGGNPQKNQPDLLTEENLPLILKAIEPLGRYDQVAPTLVDVDNALYRAGLLTQREHCALPTPESLGTLYSPFAAKLRLMLAQWKASEDIKRATIEHSAGKLSTREFERRVSFANNMASFETFHWANRVASAIEQKNLESMLSILDGPGNETSQKAVEQEFGVKLRNVSAKQRRRAVFELAGFCDDESVQREEARIAQMQKERKAKREREAITERASSFNIRIDDGDVMTCALYVDTLIQRGFTQVIDRKKGRVTNHFLMNPENRNAYPIGRANGTLEYANMLLAETQAA